MVAADDQVVRAVVAADDRVPDGLARAAHAHRQRQQGQQDAVLVVVALGQRLVGANAGEVIDVAGLGHTDAGVQQQNAVLLNSGALGQFLVDAVERVAGLESDYVRVTKLLQTGAGLGRGQSQRFEIIAGGQLQHTQLAGNIELTPAVHLGHDGMAQVQRAEGLLGHFIDVPGVDLFYVHDRQQLVTRAAQGDVLADLQRGRDFFFDWQGNRHREQDAVGQAHRVDDALVVGLAHEAIQRRKAARRQQFKVASGAIGDSHRRQRAGVGAHLGQFGRGHHEVD